MTRLHNRFGRLTERYPGAANWLASRLTTDQFEGLPLTVLTVLLVISVMTLSEIAENVVNAEPMVRVDYAFTRMLFRTRTTPMSTFFYTVTWLGSAYATVGVVLLGSVLLYRQHRWRTIVILWVLVGGVALFVQAG